MGDNQYNEYDKELLKKLDDLKQGLPYYIHRTHGLENELETVNSAYQNRVDEYVKLEKQAKEKDELLKTQDRIIRLIVSDFQLDGYFKDMKLEQVIEYYKKRKDDD